jgi:CDP-diacylglycerol--inositol 3-phosphatidyltransferase
MQWTATLQERLINVRQTFTKPRLIMRALATRFGAVLDMVTDRCSTSCLLMILSYFYRDYVLFFLPVVALDITSHYAHLYSSLARGLTSHKIVSKDQNFLLRIYYTNRKVLGALCIGNEAFFLGLYLCHFELGPVVMPGLHFFQLLTAFFAPLMLIKQLMNLIQLRQAAMDIVELDMRERKEH